MNTQTSQTEKTTEKAKQKKTRQLFSWNVQAYAGGTKKSKWGTKKS